MKKKLKILITGLLIISLFTGTVLAATPETVAPCESSYLAGYGATATSGSVNGTIKISFLVRGMKDDLTQIGVSKIVVCRYDGTPIRTYYGSTSNGLLSSGTSDHSGTYTITNLEAGTSYYAQVTVIAGNANGSDTRTVTTNTVKAGS